MESHIRNSEQISELGKFYAPTKEQVLSDLDCGGDTTTPFLRKWGLFSNKRIGDETR